MDCGIEPEGAAAAVARKLAETGPVTFIRSLEAVARRDAAGPAPPPKPALRVFLESLLSGFDEVRPARPVAGPEVTLWAGAR